MNKGFINGSKSMACGGALQRKKLTIGTIALALFVILGSPLFAQAPALQQQPSPSQRKGRWRFHRSAPPCRLTLPRKPPVPRPPRPKARSRRSCAVFVAPPMVVEQNGTLTGFSIDLWNAIAARLKEDELSDHA